MARLRYNGLTATLGADLLTAGTTITFTAGVTQHGIGLESNGIATWLFGLGGLQAVLLAVELPRRSRAH